MPYLRALWKIDMSNKLPR